MRGDIDRASFRPGSRNVGQRNEIHPTVVKRSPSKKRAALGRDLDHARLRDITANGSPKSYHSGVSEVVNDVHGELTSNAYVDIMYPAGQFDSLQHRTLMAIAEPYTGTVTGYSGSQAYDWFNG